jgi:FixJ family two-component response regulator
MLRPNACEGRRRGDNGDLMEEPAAVFVVDDDPSVRESLRRLFASEGWAVKVYADATTFLGSTTRHVLCGCLVLDANLPDLHGLDVQGRLAELGQRLPIVFLTGQGDIPMSVRAMKAGAIEFLTKPFDTERLLAVVRDGIAADRGCRQDREELVDLRRRYETLTAREREVMAGVVAGLLNKQIAAELGKTEATVKEQRGHVMSKMEASSVPELVRFASRLGLHSEPPSLSK